ncbi:protein SLC31A2-like [Saccostrea echinata]|uniref:protein SLC31A2-like n=1 Tax=Saccostrea echinata TaxID=191078 RepID=UPI002A813983|nr:protein SLC31A2-like [Saccostrea echinata]
MSSWWTTLTRSHVLHEEWCLDTYTGLICAMVAAAVLSVIFELLGVIMLRIVYICWPKGIPLQNSKCNPPSLLIRLITSIFHICGVIIGYILMLCVMTMNIWIFLSILLGTLAGHHFKRKTRKQEAEGDHLQIGVNYPEIRSRKETGSKQCEPLLYVEREQTGLQSETELLKQKMKSSET